QHPDAGVEAHAHIPPIHAVPTGDVADVDAGDVGEGSADKHIATPAGDGQHAVGAAGAAHGPAAHVIPIRSVPTRDAVGQGLPRRGEQSADIHTVVRLANAGYVEGRSGESVGRPGAERIIIDPVIADHVVRYDVPCLVETSADVEPAVFDQHAVGRIVQRILKDAVRGGPGGPREAIPFGQRTRVNTADIREPAPDVNVRAENADAAHATFATGAESGPGRAVPPGDAVGGRTAGQGEVSAGVEIIPLKRDSRDAVVHTVSRAASQR